MKTERRRVQRETPAQLSYVQLDPECGGMVLNASEGGLAFQVVGAVRSGRALQVCISPNPTERIELSGEIAWLDDGKTCGGVRFKEPTAETCLQIRGWLATECHSRWPQLVTATPAAATDVASTVGTEPRNENSALAKHLEAEDDPAPDRAGVTAPQSIRFNALSLRGALFDPIPLPAEGVFISIARYLLHFTAGILLCALVLSPILLSRNFRSRFADSLIRLGERLNETEEAHVPPPLPTPLQSSAPNSAKTLAIPDADVEIPSQETQSQPNSSPSELTRQKTPKSAALGPDDRPYSSKNSPDVRSARRGGLLAHQLWSAIGSGDTSAEVSLAQLYMTGDGVPKNCAQARVLLRAASKGGNAEAVHQLQKLNKSGCR
jgi:hypothetical protein